MDSRRKEIVFCRKKQTHTHKKRVRSSDTKMFESSSNGFFFVPTYFFSWTVFRIEYLRSFFILPGCPLPVLHCNAGVVESSAKGEKLDGSKRGWLLYARTRVRSLECGLSFAFLRCPRTMSENRCDR